MEDLFRASINTNNMTLDQPPPIETERLKLRLVEENDIADLLEVNCDEQVTRFLPYETWRSIADGKVWFDRMCALTAGGDTLQFVIVELGSARVIGSCLLFRYNADNRRAEIGFVMGRAHWKKGFTHEALSALIACAFEAYKLRRLEAEVEPANIASNQLLLKLGFTREGLLRQRWYARGNSYDTNIYGLLREEWLPDERAS